MDKVLDAVCQYRIIPVAAIENADDSLYVAQALLKAGLPLIEITFRTHSAGESIRLIREHFPEMIVGAGTVLNMEQAKSAVENGAVCIVSPGTNRQIVEYTLQQGINAFPGVMTPTEIEQAMSMGLRYVKFFPAEAAGGIKMLKTFSGPYPEMRFMPTGGINTQNVKSYLDCSNVFSCGGSWMVNKALIANRDFDSITRITKEALEMIS